MRPFTYTRADSTDAARAAILSNPPFDGTPPTSASGQFIAGGTVMLDLMKLDVMRPDILVDIGRVDDPRMTEIAAGANGIRLGALVRMADAAEHPDIVRDYPVIADALKLAASQQIRNMASLGGNVLQRTRCSHFRDTSWTRCNKRNPGSGCAAIEGFNRLHAILGVSDACIASYPGDFAQALIALDASLDILGADGGPRTLSFAELHREPGDTPHIETSLAPGDLIVAINVPAGPWTRRSAYVKVRDRESYEFAVASAAVALDMDGGSVREARLALGGVATVPWRARDAESFLRGKTLDEAVAAQAGEIAFAGARTFEHNAFKAPLGKRTVTRALLQAAGMEIRT